MVSNPVVILVVAHAHLMLSGCAVERRTFEAPPGGALDKSGAPDPRPAERLGPDTPSDAKTYVAQATERMDAGDGEGCMQELEAALTVAPAIRSELAVMYASCEMLTGACETGHRRLVAHYQQDQGMPPDRAERMARAVEVLHCDTDRVPLETRILTAHGELERSKIEPAPNAAYCVSRYNIIREGASHIPEVSISNHALREAFGSLHVNAAGCFAAIGDCAMAYKVYQESYGLGTSNEFTSPAPGVFENHFPVCR